MKVYRHILVLSLLAMALGAGFTPWVYRQAVALQLTAPHLAEYIKFLPEVRLGQIDHHRLHFLLPAASLGLSLPLIAVNRRLALPLWQNWGLRLLVFPLALVSLSPVWAPGVLFNGEFRLQTIVAGGCIGLAFIAPLFRALPLMPLLLASNVINLVALGLALRQFFINQAGISATYGQTVQLGWGAWLLVIGLGGLCLISGAIWRLQGTKSAKV